VSSSISHLKLHVGFLFDMGLTKSLFVTSNPPYKRLTPSQGTTGLLTGGISSVLLSSKTPTLFTLAAGTQCFLLGSTFWVTRSTFLYAWTPPLPASEHLSSRPLPTPQDHVYASACAGGITGGAVGGLVRGRRHFLPGILFWSLFGYAGQKLYNRLDANHSEQFAAAAAEEKALDSAGRTEKGFWDRVAEMKWSPMKTLSDEDYADMLRKKIVGLEVEIALVDEEVGRLRGEEQMEGKGANHESMGNGDGSRSAS